MRLDTRLTVQIKTLDEAFALFESRTNLEKGFPPGNPNRVYRLDRMRSLCSAFGNPQDSFRVIHLAGSKGKGSTAAYIAALLRSAGRRVGVYASPHLLDYRERFRIEGEVFPESSALETAGKLLKRLPDLENDLPGVGGATTFELLTLFAFLHFRDTGCDTAVLETGLGGRLDATNVISRPEAVVITPIEKEHTEILGNRIKKIADEKAGIMKPGTAAFSARQSFAACLVIRKKARKTGIELTDIQSRIRCISAIHTVEDDDKNDKFSWRLNWRDRSPEVLRLAMGGRVQAENAALALMVVRQLEVFHEKGAAGNISDITSLSNVKLPGRFQCLRKKPLIILDGAHTPRSVSALAEAFVQVRGSASNGMPLLLFGSVEGKDHKTMAHKLCGTRNPYFKEVIISTPGTFKPSNPAAVAESFRRTGADVTLLMEPGKAWKTILQRAGETRPILITGSFFMAGEIARLNESLKVLAL